MAEDQGVNGDIWTDEASRLLKRCGWEKVADSNIDITGSDGLKHGIDAMFKYFDGFLPSKEQGVFLEAKRYQTTSFSASKLKDWVSRFDNKIRELRQSQPFYERYPDMESCHVSNGLLMLWFHDVESFSGFKGRYEEALLAVKTPRRRKPDYINRLFVMSNDDILRIASLVSTVSEWNTDQQSQGNTERMRFHYPASAGFGHAIQETESLNLEYLYSQFLFAKATKQVNGVIRNIDVVFYFGQLDLHSFRRLKQALLSFDMISSRNDLHIYHYRRDPEEFRKIKPDAEKLFSQNGPQNVAFKTMNLFRELPNWMTD